MNTVKTLVINHVGEHPDDSARIAISPGMVKMVSSRDVNLHNRELKQVSVHFPDEVVVFTISGFELQTLEEVVAGYDFGD